MNTVTVVRRLAPAAIGCALIVIGAALQSSIAGIVFGATYLGLFAFYVVMARRQRRRIPPSEEEVRERSERALNAVRLNLWLTTPFAPAVAIYIVWQVAFTTGVAVGLVGLAIVTAAGTRAELQLLERFRRQAITGQLESD